MRPLIFGLFALMTLIQPGRALAFGDCMQPNYLPYFDIDTVPKPCTEIARFPVVTAHGRSMLRIIRFTNSAHGDDAIWTARAEQLAVALGPAIDQIGSARLPPEISVLLTEDERHIGRLQAHAVTSGMIAYDTGSGPVETECAVPFYKLPGGAAVDEFLVAVAHEVFHCAQYVTWNEAYFGEDPGWWREGSAEYFSHLAVPGTRLRDDWFAAFDSASLDRPLHRMSYENVVFFLWLATTGGPEAVGAFLDRMRPGDQLAVLREVLPLAEWRGFVEAYLDGQIHRPSGGALPRPAAFTGERTFRAPGELSVSAEDYVIRRWRLTFVADKVFELATTVQSGAPEVAMRLDGETGGWAPPPERISTCDGEASHVLYAVSTDSPGAARIAVETDADTTGGTCCLVGDWKPTPEALAGIARFGMAYGAPAVAAAGGAMNCSYQGGDWRLSFYDDGTAEIVFDGHTSQCTVSGGGGAMSSIGTRGGHSAFTWQVVGDGAARVESLEHAVTWLIQMKIGPMLQQMPGAEDPVASPAGFAFNCQEDSLIVQGIYGLGTYEAGHIRVRAAE